MAYRIGGLGGLGGFSYPARSGAPDAEAVQTDQELTNGFNQWRRGLEASIPQANDSIQSVANRAWNDYSKAYGPYENVMGAPNRTRADFVDLATRYRTGQSLAGAGEGNTGWVSGLFEAQDAENARRAAAITAQLSAGELAFDSQMKDRAENTVRQGQAYGSMTGNGQVGGVMGAGFTSPTFGQVTGQAEPQPGQRTGGFNAWGAANPTASQAGNGATGVDMSWANGAYGGGAGAFTPAPWGGLVPGKWKL